MTSTPVAGVDPVRMARIALACLVEPGDRDLGELVDEVGPVEALARLRVRGVPDNLFRTAAPRLRLGDPLDLARQAVERTRRQAGRVITPDDDEWPVQLDDLRRIGRDTGQKVDRDVYPPLCLWLRGTPRLVDIARPSVAVVGSRASTPYGNHVATELAYGIAERGWCVVSGGAFGIDAQAHRGALAAGGTTVVVLACGIDRAYPQAHASLFERVCEDGLLLSEWPPGADPHRYRFLNHRRECIVERMSTTLVARAHWGDLRGMHFAGLVRLSFEPDLHADTTGKPSKPFMSGRDIKGRDEQEKDCRAYVESRSGHYVYTYAEPDTSAFKRRPVKQADGRTVYRVLRPVLEGALDDLRRGETPDGQRLDGLIVYDIDRLTRDNRHLEDCIEVVEHFERPIIDITGTLDLLTDNGRTVARIVVATYNKQSADAGRRIKRKHQALQQAGIPVGGRRPYGWQDDKRTLHPVEAPRLREAALRALAGDSLSGIVVEWNAQGWTTASGKGWTRSKLRFVLRNPRICGLRARKVDGYDVERDREFYDMEIVRDAGGQPVIGQWQPIITVPEWEGLTAVIGTNINHEYDFNSRKYLLSGILRCGKPGCGHPMRATKILKSVKERRDGMYTYGCPGKSDGGCGGVAINGPKTDEWVTEAVLAKHELETQRRSAATAPRPWPREPELARVRENLTDLTAAWRAQPQQISSARYFGMLPDLEREERILTREREQWLAKEYAASAKPIDLRGQWPNLTLPAQRKYLQEALVCVVVHPANGPKRFNGERLELVWREG